MQTWDHVNSYLADPLHTELRRRCCSTAISVECAHETVRLPAGAPLAPPPPVFGLGNRREVNPHRALESHRLRAVRQATLPPTRKVSRGPLSRCPVVVVRGCPVGRARQQHDLIVPKQSSRAYRRLGPSLFDLGDLFLTVLRRPAQYVTVLTQLGTQCAHRPRTPAAATSPRRVYRLYRTSARPYRTRPEADRSPPTMASGSAIRSIEGTATSQSFLLLRPLPASLVGA